MKIVGAIKDVMKWLNTNLPTFDGNFDKHLQREGIMEYTKVCFLFTIVLILIVLPLWNALSVTGPFFRLTHFFRHTVFKNRLSLHSWRIWHNASVQQCVFWSILVGFCTIAEVNRDLLQVTKRMGRIAVALMPPLLFLTLRPSPLPETLYLSLLPIHKWMSRIVVIESLLHTVLYLRYFYLKGTLMTKPFKPANFYGVIAMVLFALIAVTSIGSMRRWNFPLFYYVHYLSTWSTVILLHYHARPSIPLYTILNIGILLWQIIYRISHTRVTTITTVAISPSLTLVEFPRNDLSSKPILPSGHVRLSPQHNNWLKWLFHLLVPLQHPYTVASLPTDDTIKLIVRKSHLPLISNEKYRITGVFEPRLNFMSKIKPRQILRTRRSLGNLNSRVLLHSPLTYNMYVRRALICVGGSAVSFALPLLRILNFNGVTVKLIWVSKDYRDLEILNHFTHNFEGMEIYVSGDTGTEQDIQIDYIDNAYSENDVESSASSLGEEPQGYNERSLLNWNTFRNETPSGESYLSLSEGRNKTKNYGSTGNTSNNPFAAVADQVGTIDPNDEIDFTEIFSLRNAKSKSSLMKGIDTPNSKINAPSTPLLGHDLFRKASIIEAPIDLENNENPHGRELSSRNDRVLRIPSGIKVFFGRPTLGEKDYFWCMERECAYVEQADRACRFDNSGDVYSNDLSDVVTIAAGPVGLVESTRRFATDYGLNFHAECFAV